MLAFLWNLIRLDVAHPTEHANWPRALWDLCPMPRASPGHENVRLLGKEGSNKIRCFSVVHFGPLSFVVLLHLAIPKAACQPAWKLWLISGL